MTLIEEKYQRYYDDNKHYFNGYSMSKFLELHGSEFNLQQLKYFLSNAKDNEGSSLIWSFCYRTDLSQYINQRKNEIMELWTNP